MLTPPQAPQVPKELVAHGDTRIDPYYWLRDRDTPEVLDYLKAENAYTEARTAPLRSLQARLYREMLGRIQETDLSVPVRIDAYEYYQRSEEGRAYPILCRRRAEADAPEEILLDLNARAAGHDYYDLGVYEVSPDHRWLAFSEDTDGSERYTLRFRDLDSGDLLPDAIPDTAGSAAWANDNRTLFYTVRDAASRPYQLRRHRCGDPVDSDAVIHHEPDDAFFIGVGRSKSRRYLFMDLHSNVTSETWLLEADQPEGAFRRFQPRQHGIEYHVDHHGEHFYILTNEDALNFRLLRAPVTDWAPERRETVIPHRENVKLEDLELFDRHMAVTLREEGLSKIRVFDLQTNDAHTIDVPETVYTAWTGANPEFHTRTLRFVYTSLTTPATIYDYDMDSRERTLRKRTPVLGGFDPEHYEARRTFATAPDGTDVPVSLVFRKGARLDGTAPCLLYGYGAYGASMDPGFSSTRLSLLDRGVVFAIAHVRGGGELGEGWKNDGKLLKKQNTFSDCIAAAEHLIAERYAAPDRLAIHGGSAGGLLVGAVINQRPDLFRAAVADVPFVDVLTTMLDPSLPLTVIEYDEWGNPEDPAYYEAIKAYSPYDNVRAQTYPHLLVTAGLNDTRVQYWEPAKWVARLRTVNTGDRQLLLRTNLDAGHGGASGRYEALKELAFLYAFVLDRLEATG